MPFTAMFNFMRMHIITLCINPGVLGNCPHLYFPLFILQMGDSLLSTISSMRDVSERYFIKVACLVFCLFDFPHPTRSTKKQLKVCGLFIRSNVIRSPFLSIIFFFPIDMKDLRETCWTGSLWNTGAFHNLTQSGYPENRTKKLKRWICHSCLVPQLEI